MLQVVVRVNERRGQRKAGELQLAKFKFDMAALRDMHRGLQRRFEIAEKLLHFLGRLEIDLIRVVAHPVGVGDHLAGLNTEQGVMGIGILLAQVVTVVGDDQGNACFAGDSSDFRYQLGFFFQAVVLDLEIEVSFAENLRQLAGGCHRFVRPAVEQIPVHLAFEAGRSRNQAFVVLTEQFFVDAGSMVEAFKEPGTGQFHQVLVAGVVLSQQDHMKAAIGVFVRWFLIKSASTRHIRLAADNRLDPRLGRLFVELDRPEHIAVIGDREGGHFVLAGQLDYIVEPAGTVEERILAVGVEMDEIRVFHGLYFSSLLFNLYIRLSVGGWYVVIGSGSHWVGLALSLNKTKFARGSMTFWEDQPRWIELL